MNEILLFFLLFMEVEAEEHQSGNRCLRMRSNEEWDVKENMKKILFFC